MDVDRGSLVFLDAVEVIIDENNITFSTNQLSRSANYTVNITLLAFRRKFHLELFSLSKSTIIM